MPDGPKCDLSDAELEQLLDAPVSAEEQAVVDKLVSDPEEILRRVQLRLAAAGDVGEPIPAEPDGRTVR